MTHDFSCCSLNGVQKGVKIKVCPKYKYHKMACNMVYSKNLLKNVYKTWFITGSYQSQFSVDYFSSLIHDLFSITIVYCTSHALCSHVVVIRYIQCHRVDHSSEMHRKKTMSVCRADYYEAKVHLSFQLL